MEPPSLHDQFEEIWDFVHKLCDAEAKLFLTHATDAEAPACERLQSPPRFNSWENPDLETARLLENLPPMGTPPLDIRTGKAMDNANMCPFCGSFCWINSSVPIGYVCECWQCHAKFRRGS